MFWAPTGNRNGFVQFVLPDSGAGADACAHLWQSTRLARKAITLEDEWLARGIPCAARALRHVIDPPITRCGSAVMRWDPIAGDGTGAALRSSILACAALRYTSEHPVERVNVFRHYETRIARAFCNHLTACGKYYERANLSAAWEYEAAQMREAIATAGKWADNEFSFRFRMENLSLSLR